MEEEENDCERTNRRKRGRRVDFDKMKEEDKEGRERIIRRERGRRVDEKVKPVAELARARTAGSPGTENYLRFIFWYNSSFLYVYNGIPGTDNCVYFS